MKPSTVLSAELDFDSNGSSRFSIKNHAERKKNQKLVFYSEK
jgi:hypothetical protein